MSRHADQVLDKQYNRPIANCQIFVYDSTGALVTITADGGGALTNPFNADIYGNYAFNVAVDGIYRIEYWTGKKLTYAEQVIIGTPAIFQGPPGSSGVGTAGPLFATVIATGTGSSQAITLPTTMTDDQAAVFINGIYQTPTTNYTISGTTLTITTDNVGDNIVIRSAYGVNAGSVTGMPTVATRSALATVASPTFGQAAFLAETGREGTFVWTTGNFSTLVTADTRQGIYVPPSTDTTGASGAWVRKYNEHLNVKWFGTVADNSTNDAAAIQAAINYLNSVATTGFGYSNGPGVLFIPRGRYFLGTTPLDVTLSMIIRGESVGGESGPATVLRWAYGTSGIRLQAPNTSGDSTIIPTTYLGAAGCAIENLYLEGGWAPSVAATGIEAEQHGIHMKVKATVRNCYINKWAGDGIHIWAASGSGVGSTEGNANLWYVERVACNNVRDGMNIKGADANAGTSIMLSVINARRWGINEQSFLGNVHIQSHTANCGVSEGNTTLAGMVSYNGNRYVPIVGQEAAASTNAPSGTTADNAYWQYAYAGGATTNITYLPLWTSGISVRSSGGITTTDPNARNLFLNPYTEADTPSQLIKPTLVIGGLVAGPLRGTMGYVAGTLQGTSLYNDVLVGGNLGLPGTLSVGAYNSTTNSAMEMDTGLNNNVFTFKSYVGGTPTSDLVITSRKAASATFDAPNGYTFNAGGAVKAEFTAGTVNLYGGIYVAPQGAAPNPLYNGQFWFDSTGTGTLRVRQNSQTLRIDGSLLGSAAWTPPSVAQAAQATTTVTVTGAVLGDYAAASYSLSLGGLVMSAYVSAADTVTVVLSNLSGGAVALAAGTVRASVTKQ